MIANVRYSNGLAPTQSAIGCADIRLNGGPMSPPPASPIISFGLNGDPMEALNLCKFRQETIKFAASLSTLGDPAETVTEIPIPCAAPMVVQVGIAPHPDLKNKSDIEEVSCTTSGSLTKLIAITFCGGNLDKSDMHLGICSLSRRLHAIRDRTRSVSRASCLDSSFRRATNVALAALVFGCVMPSPASPAIRTNADNLVIAFSNPMRLGQSVNSSIDSPATPIRTAVSATYPQFSQKEMSDINEEISKSIVSNIRFQHIAAEVNAFAGALVLAIMIFGKRGICRR